MISVKEKVLNFVKKEIVLIIALILAIISCFIIPPDREYFSYFEWNTLICLFCMLIVVAGLKNTNFFELVSKKLISIFHTRRAVILALVFGTFIFDLIVANDMSLITFLPLTYLVLHNTKNDKYLAFVFIMQTIAANMGGMITPYGNPQNLYLYSYFNINPAEFISILLGQFFVVAILLFICCCFIKNESLEIKNNENIEIDKQKLVVYIVLFILVILSIFRVFPSIVALGIVIMSIILIDIERFKYVDYALILTFMAFFVFSSNLARIDFIVNFITNLVNRNTLLAGIISCQFISNVPSAILLSKFTTNYRDLLIAVNVGSLGILISSLASLITLKEFLKHQPRNFLKYLGLFTLFNTLFLTIIIIITNLIY